MTRGRVGLALAFCFLTSSCGVSGLNFRADERVEITEPGDRAKVSLPVTITWQVSDFDVTGPSRTTSDASGYFGVYVDRSPQPPNKPQGFLVRDDAECKRTPGCPDRAYLDRANIYATDQTSFTIDRLPQPSSEAPRRREFHEVTIVLLDGLGRRIGESAFIRQFEVDRGSLG